MPDVPSHELEPKKTVQYRVKNQDNFDLITSIKEIEKRPFLQSMLNLNASIGRAQAKKLDIQRSKEETLQFKIL